MRLLVLGGSSFVGGSIVSAALTRGADVTVFNRGISGPPPSGATRLVGDRTLSADLERLSDDRWDAVVDTWAGAPYVVRASASVLADRADRCVYISSRAVYARPTPAGLDESADTVESSADADSIDYGVDKRGGEMAVEEAWGERAVLARAGFILGPRENLGRLAHWLCRVERGGDVLAPGPAGLPFRYVDVRDLADWVLHAAGSELSGPYNLVNPVGDSTTGSFLEAAVSATSSEAELVWVDPAFVEEHGIDRREAFPCWVPPGDGNDGLLSTDVSRALASRLRCRPIEETVNDTWTWLQADPDLVHPTFGLDPAREQSLVDLAGRR